MGQNEKTPTGDAAGVNGHDDDDINRQNHFNVNSGVKQAESSAERLFKLIAGNEHRHVRNFGPPTWSEEKQKWELKVLTTHEPATLQDWNIHLYPTSQYILSIIPLLSDGTCWFACIDYDQYRDVDYHKICRCIYDLKLPLLPVVSKSGGLHIFAFLKTPVRAELVIPVLHYWATSLGFQKGEYEVFPTSTGEDKLTRGVSMPYGTTFNVMPRQEALSESGNAQLLENCLSKIERIRITASELPEIPKESPQQQGPRKIPLSLQTAIDSRGPYPGGDRSPITASIIWQLRDLGFDADGIKTVVEGRGPFERYGGEKKKNLGDDIARIISNYDQRHPNKKAKIQVCTDIIPWDPSPPLPVEWSISDLIAAGSLTLLVGDSGLLKSFILWNMAVSRMYGEPFAHRKISKRSGVLMWLAEGLADYRHRCRAAVKAAGHDPNERLPLVIANTSMLPLTAEQSEEQLHGMIDNANVWMQEHFGLNLGCIFVDTFAQASLFKDAYKPNEIIEVNQKLRRVACSRGIDAVTTEHFPKKEKEHPAGTLNKRNDMDQMLIVEGGRMTLDKSRYGPDKIWNAYRGIAMDDGNDNWTKAIWFGPTQQPRREIDNAGIFMSALQNAQQDFGLKMRETDLQKTFIELHLAAQKENNIKSRDPKEQARSAFRREFDSAKNGAVIQARDGFVWELKQ